MSPLATQNTDLVKVCFLAAPATCAIFIFWTDIFCFVLFKDTLSVLKAPRLKFSKKSSWAIIGNATTCQAPQPGSIRKMAKVLVLN